MDETCYRDEEGVCLEVEHYSTPLGDVTCQSCGDATLIPVFVLAFVCLASFLVPREREG